MRTLDSTKQVDRDRELDLWGKRLAVVIVLSWSLSPVTGFMNALTVLVLVALGLVLIKPYWSPIAFLGMGMLVTLDPLLRVYLTSGGVLRWNTLNYWFLFIIFLNFRFILRLTNVQIRLLELLLVLLLLGLVISPDFTLGASHVLNFMAVFGLMVYIAYAIETPKAWFWIGILNGIMAGLGALVFYAQVFTTDLHAPGYIDHNAWVQFPLMALISLALSFFQYDRIKGYVGLRVFLTAVNFIWTFISGSRQGFLVGCIIIFVLYISTPRRLPRLANFLVIMMILTFAVQSQFSPLQQQSLDRLRQVLNTDLPSADRTSGRSILIRNGISLALRNPFGVGTGAFARTWGEAAYAFEREPGVAEAFYLAPKASHSAWVKVLVENSFYGFVLLLGFVMSFAIIGWRKRAQGFFPLGMLITVSVSIWFLASEFQPKAIWFISATGMAIFNHEEMAKHMQASLALKRCRFGSSRSHSFGERPNS